MDVSWLAATVPVAALAANVAAQVVWFRLSGRHRLLKSIFVGFAAGLAATAAIMLIARCADVARLASTLITYTALGYGYFHFVNLGQTARRVRLLWEIYEAGGELSRAQVLARYSAADIIAARLERLLGNRQIVLREGRYVIGRPTMRVITRLMEAWKSLVLGGRDRP